jgi:hypothetical protein
MGSNTIDNYIQVCPKIDICHYVNTRVYNRTDQQISRKTGNPIHLII